LCDVTFVITEIIQHQRQSFFAFATAISSNISTKTDFI